MIEFILREIIQGTILAGAAWCWHVFVRFILPIAVERCPWAEDCEGPL